MEKLSKILYNTQIERIVETESFVLQIANLISICLLIMREIVEHVWNHLTELNDVKEEFDDLDRIRLHIIIENKQKVTAHTMMGAKSKTIFLLQNPST